MEIKTKYLIVISFDGLSTKDFDKAAELPNFKRLLAKSAYCKNVYSIYPSLTYPAHTTIVTGRLPKNHGIINNTLLQPGAHSPDWYWQRKFVKCQTIYDLVIDKGMKVAALLWPVTGRSRIQYNLPEVFANRSWQNQVMVSLYNGSPLYQLELSKRFGKLLNGIKQPNLDDFLQQSVLFTIKEKRPSLLLAHYTDLDWARHFNGFESEEANAALVRHDTRLGGILDELENCGISEESTIIVLGDHSSIDEDKIIYLNVLLRQEGYIELDKNGHIKSYRALAKNCDGSSYIYLKDRSDVGLVKEIKRLIEQLNDKYKCIEILYTSEEASKMGADPYCTFMLEAAEGYYFLDDHTGELIKEVDPDEAGIVPHITVNTHGYAPLKKDYSTVFIASGAGIRENVELKEMSLVDEAPTMARLLGIQLNDVDGRVLREILK